jgi:hypothetical protein
MLERKRLSFLFTDVHTLQLQAIMGTPCDVPVPKNVTFILSAQFILFARNKKQPYK